MIPAIQIPPCGPQADKFSEKSNDVLLPFRPPEVYPPWRTGKPMAENPSGGGQVMPKADKFKPPAPQLAVDCEINREILSIDDCPYQCTGRACS